MAPKRKGTNKGVSPKKVKTSNDESQQLSTSQIKSMAEKTIDNASYNDIVHLLNQFDYIKSTLMAKESEEIENRARQLTVSVYQVFYKLFHKGLMKPKRAYDEKKNLLINWLTNKYDRYKGIINDFIATELSFKSSLQLDMMEVMLKLLKLESEFVKSNKQDLYFPQQTYHAFIKSLLSSNVGEITSDGTSDNFILLEFLETFKQYYDLQVYFYQNLLDLFDDFKSNQQFDHPKIFSNYFTIIRESPLFVEDVSELKKFKTLMKSQLPASAYKKSQFKSQYQKALLSGLSMKVTSYQYKSLLLVLNKRILPYLAQPACLMDFLTDCYSQNDDLIIQILSLNSLYELMKQYNLEYPDFYPKLYSLLTPGLLHNRYRSRFFRLCDLFLSSTHISSQLVASFIKKLCRLSLLAPAPGAVIIIPFIYNLMKRHPSCMIMIQNPNPPEDYKDPFEVEELNPLKTNAINSSLWELEPLMNHYHPNVSTLAQIFKNPFTKPHYNLEDFLDWSYKSLLDLEQNRKYKSMAALEYETFEHLLGSDNSYLTGWST